MTYDELQKEISQLEKDIADFTTTHGSPLGCSNRTLTLVSMQNHLNSLYEQLYQTRQLYTLPNLPTIGE